MILKSGLDFLQKQKSLSFPRYPNCLGGPRSALYSLYWADTENCWGKVLSTRDVEVTRIIVGARDIGV